MSFAAPTLLWLMLCAPAAALAAAALWRSRRRAESAWAARGLWQRLRPAGSRLRLAASVATLGLAVLGVALALARPRWGASEETVQRRGVDVVFVVDSSLSMGALDVEPSRLFAAKTLVRRLVAEMPGNRVGLVQTEGESQVLAPLTTDGAVVDLLLDAIEPGTLPIAGSALGSGVESALELFAADTKKHRVLILLSDGEDHTDSLSAQIDRLGREGVVAFAFGVGTPDGAPVPVPGRTDVKRTADGSVVVSRLHEGTLESLARATGGLYRRATSPAAEIAEVLRKIGAIETRSFESQVLSTLEERFQWPLVAAVLALALHLAFGPFRPGERRALLPAPVVASRRRRAAAITLRLSLAPLVLFALPELPDWLPWKPRLPLWAERVLYNPRERTAVAIERFREEGANAALGPAQTALRLAADDPRVQYNAGSALLAAGRPRRAAELLERAAARAAARAGTRAADNPPRDLAAAAHFNLGNARLAAGDAAGAVAAYPETLRLAPGHRAGKHNLEIALARREDERLRFKRERPGPRGDRQGDREESDRGGGQEPSPAPAPKSAEADRGESERAGQAGMGPGPLQRFRDQPEMSAREAAVVLAAVDNLERQRRRDQAERVSRQRPAGGKDW